MVCGVRISEDVFFWKNALIWKIHDGLCAQLDGHDALHGVREHELGQSVLLGVRDVCVCKVVRRNKYGKSCGGFVYVQVGRSEGGSRV